MSTFPGPWQVRKTTHSRRPWRIFAANGEHITLEVESVEIHGGTRIMSVYGYDTKADALEALGDAAAKFYALWQEVSE